MSTEDGQRLGEAAWPAARGVVCVAVAGIRGGQGLEVRHNLAHGNAVGQWCAPVISRCRRGTAICGRGDAPFAVCPLPVRSMRGVRCPSPFILPVPSPLCNVPLALARPIGANYTWYRSYGGLSLHVPRVVRELETEPLRGRPPLSHIPGGMRVHACSSAVCGNGWYLKFTWDADSPASYVNQSAPNVNFARMPCTSMRSGHRMRLASAEYILKTGQGSG